MKEIEVQSKSEEIVFAPLPKSKRFKDITGSVYGYLTVIGLSDKPRTLPAGRTLYYWWCRCVCGNCKQIGSTALKCGKAKSCGCKYREFNLAAKGTHGKNGTTEWVAWSSMRDRCMRKNHPAYHHYGGRGITVCERWGKFENFFEDMGVKPSTKHSLDRIDNHGGYEPGNCRWATCSEQSRNRRGCVMISHNGIVKSAAEWSEHMGWDRSVIYGRIKRGWSVDRLLTAPVSTRINSEIKPPSQTASTAQHA